MSSPPFVARTSGRRPADPWVRYGWVMGAIWIVFLVYPVLAVIRSGRPDWAIGAGLSILGVFAVVYVLGLRATVTGLDGRTGALAGVRAVAVLVLLSLLLVPVAGVGALGTATFVLATLIFSVPWRAGLAATVAVGALALLWPLLADEPELAAVYAPLVLLVGAVCLAIRALNTRQAEHEELAERLALVGERERVARDVHDVLGHSLTVISLKADLAARVLDSDPDRARTELADLQRLARTSLADVRATVTGLRVARLEQERAAAIQALASAGIVAHLPEDPQVVDPEHRVTIAWALREAVTNVVRHSRARRVEIEWGPSWLEVRDNGRGLLGRREGNGLRGLRERVVADGGSLLVDGGGGTGPHEEGGTRPPLDGGAAPSRDGGRVPCTSGTRLRVDLA